MKRSSAALIILAIMAASCQRAPEVQQTGVIVAAEPAKRSVTTAAELASYVDTLADRLTREDQFSGVVLLARMGQPILRKGYGLADRDTKRPNTPETSFALGSVSKMFTAVLVARMIEQGRISPERTIGSLLNDFPAGQTNSHVTVHHLLTMSSGIPDVWRLPAFWTTLPKARTLADFWPVFGTAPLEFTPGTQWRYSNSNYLVLGAVVERVFGEPFIAVRSDLRSPSRAIHPHRDADRAQPCGRKQTWLVASAPSRWSS